MATNDTVLKSEAQMSGQLSTFFVDDLFFGVDVLDVQEVLRYQQMTPVPQAPDVVEGLINLRGQIVTAIDLRRRLLLPPRSGEQTPMNIVVRTADGAVSLLVDEIGDVLEVDAANYERPPENLEKTARDLIRGVYKLKDQLLLVLDTEKACEVGAVHVGRVGAHDGVYADGGAGLPWNAPGLNEVMAAETFEAKAPRASVKRGSKRAAGPRSSATVQLSPR